MQHTALCFRSLTFHVTSCPPSWVADIYWGVGGGCVKHLQVNEFGLNGQPSLQAQYCNDNDCSPAALAAGAAVQPDVGPMSVGNVRGTVAYR